MIKRLFSLAALMLALAACTSELDNMIEETRLLNPDDEDMMFYATLEGDDGDADAQTKVYADEKVRVLWNADDRITIFKKFTYGYQYRFTGNEGANAGGFKVVDSDDEFITGESLDYYYAVYPYSPENEMDYEGNVRLNLPAVQTYKQKSFGIGANTMLSVTTNNQLKFRNVGGYLSFKFYGDGVSVKSITLRGNNHEKLSGAATVTMPVNDVPTVTMQDNAQESVTLTCKSPVYLGSSESNYKEFWFVLPPTKFSQGFTVTVMDIEGRVFEKTTQNVVEVTRNALTTMKPMPVVPIDPPYQAVDLGLSVKWASCNVGAQSPEDYGDHFAWGETSPKGSYWWNTYFHSLTGDSYDNVMFNKYNMDINYGPVDNRTVLEMSDDAARVNWGGKWRMPTDAEWTALRDNCDWTWTTQNGVNGYLVTSRTNANSIFLPAAGGLSGGYLFDAGSWGYYWSSSLDTDGPREALRVRFDSGGVGRSSYGRCLGLTVRPVYGDLIPVSDVHLNKTNLSLTEGSGEQLTARVLPTNATEKSVIWSSSKPSVASVDENGYVVAMEAGTAVITVTTIDGRKTAQCAVTVMASFPEAVDLGLSVKWATFNVGASSPEEYGGYFAWGETLPKANYNWSTYKWCNGSYKTLTRYNNSSEYGTVDNRTTLLLEDDAARANWGGKWRMPTDAEWTELRTNCDWTWTTQNGVNGYLVKSTTNTNSIFLPAAGGRDSGRLNLAGSWGYYWSSSLSTGIPFSAYYVGFYSAGVSWGYYYRCYGLSVRPVTE